MRQLIFLYMNAFVFIYRYGKRNDFHIEYLAGSFLFTIHWQSHQLILPILAIFCC
jgi:hypothetical protein